MAKQLKTRKKASHVSHPKKGAEILLRGLGQIEPLARALIHVEPGPQTQRMILLPGRSLKAMDMGTASAGAFMLSLSGANPKPPVPMKVIDSVHENGAKLVEMTSEAAQKLRENQPGLIVVPERFFKTAVQTYRVESIVRASAATGGSRKIVLTVISSVDGQPVVGANVVAFTDFATKTGAQGTTSRSGTVSLSVPGSPKRFQRVYIYPAMGFWSGLVMNAAVEPRMSVKLLPLDLGYTDGMRHFWGYGKDNDGASVKVGIVDTGIALSHPDLTVVGGECTVPGEDPQSYGPLGGVHGSHVAGIVAAHGRPPKGIRGMAPAAALYSYRVFPTPATPGQETRASNYAIAKAIDRAVSAGCDLINLSLGGGGSDPATVAAINDAHQAGTVVIAAAGNDGRQPVAFPGSDDLCLAISALGRKDTFPPNTVDVGEITGPYGTDKANFIAAFSNIGPELSATGPGVGIISTVPEKGYAAMSGTSMACPAVVGAAARIFARNAPLMNSARNENRANGLSKLVLQSCKSLGFGQTYQGAGLPQP